MSHHCLCDVDRPGRRKLEIWSDSFLVTGGRTWKIIGLRSYCDTIHGTVRVFVGPCQMERTIAAFARELGRNPSQPPADETSDPWWPMALFEAGP